MFLHTLCISGGNVSMGLDKLFLSISYCMNVIGFRGFLLSLYIGLLVVILQNLPALQKSYPWCCKLGCQYSTAGKIYLEQSCEVAGNSTGAALKGNKWREAWMRDCSKWMISEKYYSYVTVV